MSIVETFKTEEALRRAAEAQADAGKPVDLKPTLLQIDFSHPHRDRYRIRLDGKTQRASDYVEVHVLGRCATRHARRDTWPFALMYDDDNCPVHEKVYGTFEIELIDPAAEAQQQRQDEEMGFFYGIPFHSFPIP